MNQSPITKDYNKKIDRCQLKLNASSFWSMMKKKRQMELKRGQLCYESVKQKKFTQEELAQIYKVDPSVISRAIASYRRYLMTKQILSEGGENK
jgi:hypothetical protein